MATSMGANWPTSGHNDSSSSHHKYGSNGLPHGLHNRKGAYGREFAYRHSLAVVAVTAPVMADRLGDAGVQRGVSGTIWAALVCLGDLDQRRRHAESTTRFDPRARMYTGR